VKTKSFYFDFLLKKKAIGKIKFKQAKLFTSINMYMLKTLNELKKKKNIIIVRRI
jgi:hypothetical protein